MTEVGWPGPGGPYRVTIHRDVYRPGEDTMLLASAVWELANPGERFLEVGCGSGAVSLVAARRGLQVFATDVNPHAVALARGNITRNGLQADIREGDLAAGSSGPFDVVAFNPPYLPTAPNERLPGPLNLAFDGGEDGNDTVRRFAEVLSAWPHLPRLILVVHSSLADPGPLETRLAKAGYGCRVHLEEAHTFERIMVRAFERPAPPQRQR